MEPRKPVLTSAVAPALAFLLMALPGCDSAKLVRPPVDNTYRAEAAFVKEANRDAADVVAGVLRNDEAASDITVSMGEDTLQFDSLNYSWDIYTLSLGAADSLVSGASLLSLDDDDFSASFATIIPATPAITDIVPRLVGPADEVRVSWTGAAGTEGYILAAVKLDSAYRGDGWSQFVSGGLTSDVINDSAFTRTTLQGAEPNPGIYLIYVYAFTGSPDSALTESLLPVPLPAQLPDNIDETDVSGHIGAVVVSVADTVEVLSAP